MKSLTDLAGNLDASTAQVLTALRIVATGADVEEIAEWAAKELGGYKEEEELPAHRTWKLTIKASLHNPVHRRPATTNRYAHLDDATLRKAAEWTAVAIERKLWHRDGRLPAAEDGGRMTVEPNELNSVSGLQRNLSTTLRHRRFLFTDSFLLLWKWRVG